MPATGTCAWGTRRSRTTCGSIGGRFPRSRKSRICCASTTRRSTSTSTGCCRSGLYRRSPSPRSVWKLLRGVLPTEMFPAEQPAETEALHVQLMEAFVLLGGLTGRLEIDGPLGDPVDVGGRCQEVVTEYVVLERNTMKDVLFGQRCHLGDMTDLDAIAGDYGRARPDGAPRNHGFRFIAHCIEHTPPSAYDAVASGESPAEPT